ncbi:hypothetical protein [Bacillus phage CM1]|nr:hypothetical protein [Bacillus phage CM1]
MIAKYIGYDGFRYGLTRDKNYAVQVLDETYCKAINDNGIRVTASKEDFSLVSVNGTYEDLQRIQAKEEQGRVAKLEEDRKKREQKTELKTLLKEMLEDNEIEVKVDRVFRPNRLDNSEYQRVQIAIDGRIYYDKVDGWEDR